MSNENITPEIREYAEYIRKSFINTYNGKYEGVDQIGVLDALLPKYRLCLEIMKLEKEL